MPPSLSFVPFAYPPLFFYASVPFVWLAGPGFAALRIVSVISTVVTAGAIVADVGWNLCEGDTLSFICECGVRGCIETVELTIAEYFDLGDQGPIVKAGHYHS